MHTPKISIIAAMDEKRGIGKGGRIPWHIKEDLIRLKKLTLGNVVILGRKSYDSMCFYYDKSGREMPGKLYIVVTRNRDYKPTRSNACTVNSLESALKIVRGMKEKEVFVIGGAQIFTITMPFADKLYLTIVKGSYQADTFFPDFGEFSKIISKESHTQDDITFDFITLERP